MTREISAVYKTPTRWDDFQIRFPPKHGGRTKRTWRLRKYFSSRRLHTEHSRRIGRRIQYELPVVEALSFEIHPRGCVILGDTWYLVHKSCVLLLVNIQHTATMVSLGVRAGAYSSPYCCREVQALWPQATTQTAIVVHRNAVLLYSQAD